MNTYLVWFNALVCTVICIRVLTYHKDGARHRPWVSRLAYAVVLATGFVVIRTLFGRYVTVDVSEVVLNTIFMVAVCAARGNLAVLMSPFRPWDGKERRRTDNNIMGC